MMIRISLAIGWTLLHFVWQAVAILMIYGGIKRNPRFAKPADRYTLALIALLSMALISIATLSYELEVLHLQPLASITTTVATPANLQGLQFVPWRIRHQVEHFSVEQFMLCLDLFWFSGVSLLAIRTLGGLHALKRIRGASREVSISTMVRLRKIVAKMDLNRTVVLRLHPSITSPFVAGSIRSVIYLPVSAFTQLDPDQFDAILAHELAHIRRADFAWNLVQTVIETLFFFHPAVWYLSNVLREERELCCDDDVLAAGVDPLKYAKALLALANLASTPSVAMASDGHQAGGLFSRIARILEEPIPSDRTSLMALPVRYLLTGAGLALMAVSLFITSLSRPANQARVLTTAAPAAVVVSESRREPLAQSQHPIRHAKFVTAVAPASGASQLLNQVHGAEKISSDLLIVDNQFRLAIPHPASHANADANADAHAAADAHARAREIVHLHVNESSHVHVHVPTNLRENRMGWEVDDES